MEPSRSSPPLRIAYFGHDGRETAIQRRIASLETNNCRVVAFTFLRKHQAERAVIPFENIPLGFTVDRNYLRRLVPLAVGLVRTLRKIEVIRRADVLQARNIDMLALAVATKLLTGAKSKVVYEVLDIQRIFVGQGRVSGIVRAVERLLLNAVDIVVVSSPDFMKRYFEPIQGYSGPWHLLENKISAAQMQSAPDAYGRSVTHPPVGETWVIGWFGVLRCRRSLEILTAIADRLGPKVKIYIRGRLSHEDIAEAEFRDIIDSRTNMVFDGPYMSPDDLAEIYSKVHFSWSVDYTDAGANSDWLLPNRIYEGGYFNTVALTRHGTTTGRMVSSLDLGRAFREPLEQSIGDFLERLNEPGYESLHRTVAAKPRDLFVDETDTRDFLARLSALEPTDPLDRDQLQHAR